ncbi:hypothetical protein BO78DRAFT_52554 [Aspergillus sclerotiicarbonarius CBS 121057]|uniref:Uncharacterized protein n=1 Tax=Aspergillus sclerotiicarbonarius (strain CBS 121057 / IBT 28362) TaxID=1448318 RepID=A0A319F182_ASPSB|nr:hypothetical protein BO78DRAFT_52554 [Aspergillus sclerotiicarbonarius CBS 121057]
MFWWVASRIQDEIQVIANREYMKGTIAIRAFPVLGALKGLFVCVFLVADTRWWWISNRNRLDRPSLLHERLLGRILGDRDLLLGLLRMIL